MDLRQLRYFVEVAERGSFNHAAARLHISQSSLSRRVRDLEDELGTRLFDRDSLGVRLTKAGGIMLSHATALLRDAEEARAAVITRAGLPAGEVTIGTSPAAGRALLGAVAEAFHSDHPRLRLRFVVGAQFTLYEGLGTEKIDLAVMISPDPMRHYVVEPVLIERLHLVSPKRRGDGRNEIAVSDLRALPFVMFPRPTGIRTVLDQAAAEAGIDFDVRYELADVSAQLDFVYRGLAYGILSKSAIRDNKGHRSLSSVPIAGLTLTRSLVFHANAKQPSAVTAVADRIRTVLRSRVIVDDPDIRLASSG